MLENEKVIAANAIILKIHVITGWLIPEPAFAEILKDQFIKKMNESYSTVNVDEIEYAFRTYGHAVHDWGKSMNLSIIDEVMIPYLEARRALSKVEEQKKQKQLDAPKESMSEETYKSWYESVAADFKENKVQLEFLPPMLADWLIGKGELDHEQYFKRAAIMIGKRLGKEGETDKVKYAEYVDFKNQYEKAVKKNEPFTGSWALQIERLAKQIALNNYILQEQEF